MIVIIISIWGNVDVVTRSVWLHLSRHNQAWCISILEKKTNTSWSRFQTSQADFFCKVSSGREQRYTERHIFDKRRPMLVLPFLRVWDFYLTLISVGEDPPREHFWSRRRANCEWRIEPFELIYWPWSELRLDTPFSESKACKSTLFNSYDWQGSPWNRHKTSKTQYLFKRLVGIDNEMISLQGGYKLSRLYTAWSWIDSYTRIYEKSK